MRLMLLDRDGVINQNRSTYVLRWDDFVFLPGVLWSLRKLHEMGIATAIVTNQSAVNRGLCLASEVEAVHERMLDDVEAAGGGRPRVYCCPHRPDELCDCRKPQSGMLKQACRDHTTPPEEAWLIGDAVTDLAAAAGCGIGRTFVLSGRGLQEFHRSPKRIDCAVATSLASAVWRLLEAKNQPSSAISLRAEVVRRDRARGY